MAIFFQYSSELYQIFGSCVLCGYRINTFQLICIIYTRISQNSMVTNYAFTENLRLRKLLDIVMKFSEIVHYSIGHSKYFGFLFKLLDNFYCPNSEIFYFFI